MLAPETVLKFILFSWVVRFNQVCLYKMLLWVPYLSLWWPVSVMSSVHHLHHVYIMSHVYLMLKLNSTKDRLVCV